MNLTCCPNCGAWHNPEDKTPPADGHVVVVQERYAQPAEVVPPVETLLEWRGTLKDIACFADKCAEIDAFFDPIIERHSMNGGKE